MEITPAKVRRRRRSEAEREKMVALYRASGKTQGEFAREAGISLGSLAVWLRRARERGEGGKLIEVQMRGLAREAVPLEVEFPGGIFVRIAVGTPAGWASEVIGRLRCGV